MIDEDRPERTPLQRSTPVQYDDDPRVVEEQAADDYVGHVVPLTARVERSKLTMAWWSVASAIVWLFYGALASTLYGTRDAFIGIVLAAIVLALVTGFVTGVASRTGLNSYLLTRRIFGHRGAALIALLVAATTLYFTVFESSVLAVAFQSYVGALNIKLWYLIVILGMLPLMLGSVQTYLAKLNAYLLPLYFAGLVALIVTAVVKSHGAPGWWSFHGVVPPIARPVPGWLASFSLYMGLWILVTVSIDFARFSRTEDLRFHRLIGFGPGLYFLTFIVAGLVGALVVRSLLPKSPTAEAGVVQAILAAMGIWGLLFIIVTQTRINSLNYYLSSTNFERLAVLLTRRVRLPRPVWILLVAAGAYLLMLTNVFSYIQTALTWQGDLLLTWGVITVMHFLLSRRDRVEGPEFRSSRLTPISGALAVWGVAAGIGIALTQDTTVFPALSAVAPLIAGGVAGVLYLVTYRWANAKVRPGDWEPSQIGDPWEIRLPCSQCGRFYVGIEMDANANDHGTLACLECAQARRTRSAGDSR